MGIKWYQEVHNSDGTTFHLKLVSWKIFVALIGTEPLVSLLIPYVS